MLIKADDFIKDRRNAARGIREAIAFAMETGGEGVLFSSGEYHLEDFITIKTLSAAHDDGCGNISTKECHLYLKGLKNFSLVGACGPHGQPETLLTGVNPGQIQTGMPTVLWAEDCQQLAIRHIGFSRSPETACCGRIEKIENGEIYVRAAEGVPVADTMGAYCMNRYHIERQELLGESLTFGFGFEQRFQHLGRRLLRLRDKTLAGQCRAGEGLSFHQAGKTDFLLFFGGCTGLTFQNIRIYNTNSFGMLTENCQDIWADQFVIKPAGEQFFAGPRDGWKIYRCSGNILVENSHFEGVRMDGQNVHSNYLTVDQVLDDRTILCKCKYAPIPLKNYTDLIFSLGRERIPVQMVRWEIAGGEMEASCQEKDKTAGAAAVGAYNHITCYRIVLGKPLDQRIGTGCLAEAACWMPDRYTCRNTVFRNIAGAGNLIRCSHVTLKDNLYENLMNAGILLGAELATHCESGHVSDVTIRNNVFRNIGFRPRYGPYGCACIGVKSQGFQDALNQGILIEDNEFYNSICAIELNDVRNVEIHGNYFHQIQTPIKENKETTENIRR